MLSSLLIKNKRAYPFEKETVNRNLIKKLKAISSRRNGLPALNFPTFRSNNHSSNNLHAEASEGIVYGRIHRVQDGYYYVTVSLLLDQTCFVQLEHVQTGITYCASMDENYQDGLLNRLHLVELDQAKHTFTVLPGEPIAQDLSFPQSPLTVINFGDTVQKKVQPKLAYVIKPKRV